MLTVGAALPGVDRREDGESGDPVLAAVADSTWEVSCEESADGGHPLAASTERNVSPPTTATIMTMPRMKTGGLSLPALPPRSREPMWSLARRLVTLRL